MTVVAAPLRPGVSWTALLVKLLLSAAFLALAFSQVQGGDLAAWLERAVRTGPAWLALAVTLGLAAAAVNAVKWQLLLKAVGVDLPYGRVLQHYMAGYFLNTLLTGTGEVKRIYDVGRESGRAPEAFVSVFVERWAGIVSQVTLSFGALVVAATYWKAALLPALAVGLAMLAVMALYSLVSRWPGSERAPRWIASRPGLARWLDQAHAALVDVRPAALMAAVGLSVASVAMVVALHICLVLALGATGQGWGFLLLVPLAVAFGQVPVSINGFGVQELAYIELFRMAGMEPSAGLAISMLAHAVKMAAGGTGIIAILMPGREIENSERSRVVQS